MAVDDEFVRELSSATPDIYGYIFGIVGNWADADEVYQETSVFLWQERERYEHGTNFRAWAFRVALNKTRELWHKKRKFAIPFSDAFIDAVSRDFQESRDEAEYRLEVLEECLSKLKDQDRGLINDRYMKGESVKSIAEHLGRSRDTIYKAFNRIHTNLLECVLRMLAIEERR